MFRVTRGPQPASNGNADHRWRRLGQTDKRREQYLIHALGMDGEVLDDRPQGQSWQKVKGTK